MTPTLTSTDYKLLIEARLIDLKQRLRGVEEALDEPASADLNDQAIELEDDEVLEGVGRAGLREIYLLQQALKRIEEGTYGICQQCGNDISSARLEAVPYTMVCRHCAQPAKH